jgi:hypothetical protein
VAPLPRVARFLLAPPLMPRSPSCTSDFLFELLVGGGLLALISLFKVLDLHCSHTNYQT